jgi:C-terminal processing protease CtpA/Prc
MIATLLTYLIEPGARLNFNNFEQRTPEGLEREQWWTVSFVPGTRFHGKPIYVLISPLTGSAAEEFAYDVKTHKLGTVIGAPSAGGAHPGGLFRLNRNFGAFIATGRAVNPVTNTNWEGVGVQPDVAAKPEEALRVALVAAIQKLLEKPSDDEHKAMLELARTVAQETPVDPVEDFVPRRLRAQR